MIEEILKQQTVQTMVHDMRAPMTVLKGNLLLLLSGVMGEMSSDQRLLLRRSMGPLEDLIQMTETILQAVSLDKDDLHLQPVKTDLDELLSELVDFYQVPFKQRQMQLYRDGNSFGAKLLVDPFWTKRVLHNLVWNAYKFTPDKGKVVLHVRHAESGAIELTVDDTGRGIPADRLQNIFEKFSQVSPASDRRLGNGLGLWICKRVMELHEGSIRVASVVGQGSQFVLQFPAKRIV